MWTRSLRPILGSGISIDDLRVRSLTPQRRSSAAHCPLRTLEPRADEHDYKREGKEISGTGRTGFFDQDRRSSSRPEEGAHQRAVHLDGGSRWADQDVYRPSYGTKRYHHPLVGELTLGFEAFTPMGDLDQTLGLYTVEPGSPSEHALRMLASLDRRYNARITSDKSRQARGLTRTRGQTHRSVRLFAAITVSHSLTGRVLQRTAHWLARRRRARCDRHRRLGRRQPRYRQRIQRR